MGFWWFLLSHITGSYTYTKAVAAAVSYTNDNKIGRHKKFKIKRHKGGRSIYIINFFIVLGLLERGEGERRGHLVS